MRADAPTPDARFRRTLDDRLAAGFPHARRVWPKLPARRALGALAVASALLAVGVVVGTGALTDDGRESVSAPPGDVARPEAAPSAGAAVGGSPGTASFPAAPSAATPARAGAATGRKVERTTTLALTTDAAGLQAAADGIVRATQDLGGVVASSQVDSSPSGGEATFVMRVPTDRLDTALKRFGKLAAVARLSQGAEDITGAFGSAQDRLSDARAERRALLAALGKASTPRAIAGLRARIAGNRREIARLHGDLRALRRRADLVRVDVTLTASGATAPGAGAAWGPSSGARDALRVLGVLAGVALLAAVVLVPVGLIGGVAALAARALRRRRRSAALGVG